MKEEIADVMNYCLLLSDKLGIDAGKAVYDKLQKSAAKYPVEKCKGVSTKYDRLYEVIVCVYNYRQAIWN